MIIIGIFHGIKIFSTSWPIHFQERNAASCLFKQENRLMIQSDYIFLPGVSQPCLSSINILVLV